MFTFLIKRDKLFARLTGLSESTELLEFTLTLGCNTELPTADFDGRRVLVRFAKSSKDLTRIGTNPLRFVHNNYGYFLTIY